MPAGWEIRSKIFEFLHYKNKRHGYTEVAFYGGNFLGIERSYRELVLKEANSFVKEGLIDGIRFSTRPDTVEEKCLEEVLAYGVRTIELGIQSLDDTVLRLSERGHTEADALRAIEKIREKTFFLGLQIMPGLPGDTEETILKTGQRAAESSPDFVRIYPTVVLRGTKLERMYCDGSFQPLSIDSAVGHVKNLYKIFTSKNIPVVRMGLHSDQGLLESKSIVAGPYHPAFGDLVHSSIFLDLVHNKILNENLSGKYLSIAVNPADVSRLLGHKRANIKKLTLDFKLTSIDIFQDSTIERDHIRIKADIRGN